MKKAREFKFSGFSILDYFRAFQILCNNKYAYLETFTNRFVIVFPFKCITKKYVPSAKLEISVAISVSPLYASLVPLLKDCPIIDTIS